MDGIRHVATPVDFSKPSLEDVVVPTVDGTLTLLAYVLMKGASRLTRVVVTASGNTVSPVIGSDPSPGYFYTVKDFQDAVYVFLDLEKGLPFASGFAYIISKAKAEQAVWQWRKKTNHHLRPA
jgi:hypothetical protein